MFKIKKVLKRAFTIVELVVVIAVIAALAAILIPTFANVISAANESADQQAVKNMNTALYTEEKTSGKPDSPEAAMQVIEEAGYTVKDYVAQVSTNVLYYDWTENRVLIWSTESNSVTYPSDMAEKYSGVTGIAANWYTLSDAYIAVEVTTSEELSSKISDAKSSGTTTIISVQSDDLEIVGQVFVTDSSQITIDLNDHEIKLTGNSGILATQDGGSLYIKDGTINYTGTGNKVLQAAAGGALTVENVNIESTSFIECGLWAGDAATQVNIIDSEINIVSYYGITTNAENNGEHSGVTINVENSQITVTDATDNYDCAGILFNVEGTLNITDSSITADRQGVIVRGGTATIENSTITCTGNYTGSSYYLSDNWKTGNEVPMGALIVGNRSTSYKYTSSCTLQNVTLNASTSSNSNNQLVYMYSSNGYRVDLVYSGCNFSNSDINGKGNNDTNGAGGCYINGTLVS